MASSSSWLALAPGLLICLTGCWTGHLVEAGRMREEVVTYHAAAVDGERLRLDYTVERVDARQRPRGTKERSAIVAVADLAANPAYPVDAFPVERVSSGSRGGREIPVMLVSSRNQTSPVVAGASSSSFVMEIDGQGVRHDGFRLCGTSGRGCVGHFHSAALHRDYIVWWVYPLAPLTLGVDAVLFPLQLVTMPPLLAVSD
jgi:hypothetical protein